MKQGLYLIMLILLLSCTTPPKVLYQDMTPAEFSARLMECFSVSNAVIWPLGMLGRDPRIHASPEHGKAIVDFEVDKMKKVIRRELEKLK